MSIPFIYYSYYSDELEDEVESDVEPDVEDSNTVSIRL